MTALTAIGIILAIVALVALGLFMRRKSVEDYQIDPFSLGKIAFVAVAVVMAGIGAGIGWLNYEPGDNFLLDSGLDALVLFAAASLMYLGQTIWLIRKTNYAIGIVAPALMAALSATILAVVAYLVLSIIDQRSREKGDS